MLKLSAAFHLRSYLRRMRLFAFLLLLSALVSCNGRSGQAKTENADSSVLYFPFAARFELNHKKANRLLVQKVMEVWKGYESGQVRTHAATFADSVLLITNNTVQHLPVKQFLESWQRARSGLLAVQVHFEHWQALYNETRGEQWVLLWIQLERTEINHTKSSKAIHQIWKFDRNEKVRSLVEYETAFNW
jgi:hypothetical protein